MLERVDFIEQSQLAQQTKGRERQINKFTNLLLWTRKNRTDELTCRRNGESQIPQSNKDK